MNDTLRQPPGTPTGGQFAPGRHAEAGVALDDHGHDVARAADAWGDRPVHDLVTQMAPDLAAAMDRLGEQPPPSGLTREDWATVTTESAAGFRAVDRLMNAPGRPGQDAAQVPFDLAMTRLRQHANDGVAKALAPIARPALTKFRTASRAYPEHMTHDEWLGKVDTMIDGFAAAEEPPDGTTNARVDAGMAEFTEHYTQLWT